MGPGILGSKVHEERSLTAIVSPDAVLVPDRNGNGNSGRAAVPDNSQKTGKRQRESNVEEEGEGEGGGEEATARRGSRGGLEVGLGQADFIAMPAEEDG